MNKYKICVYAIAKNEEKFVDRWIDSMKEADEIFVLDTGSTDNTVNKLKQSNVKVTQKKYETWRFDKARNDSLNLVPNDYDICICTDLDEVFDKGWRKEIENLWDEQTDRLAYNYIWSFDELGNPGTTFYIEKIHSRKNYIWINPVHEVLKKIVPNNLIKKTTDKITLKHYQDQNKSRSSYLPLLELSVKEDPNNDRNVHYLGREYMYYERYEDAIKTLHQHLKLRTSTWKDERAASMRFIARSYKRLKYFEESIMWYKEAIIEAPHLREAYTELGFLYYDLEQYQKSIDELNKALEIKDKPKTYINEAFCYNERIHDILSLDYYFLNDYENAINSVKKAIEINNKDERLKNNLIEYEKKMNH